MSSKAIAPEDIQSNIHGRALAIKDKIIETKTRYKDRVNLPSRAFGSVLSPCLGIAPDDLSDQYHFFSFNARFRLSFV